MTLAFDTDNTAFIEDYFASLGTPIFKAVKKPIPVTVIGPIPHDCEIRTLESKGSNHHVSVGAYIIIGNHNDAYGIQADIFENTYDAVSRPQEKITIHVEGTSIPREEIDMDSVMQRMQQSMDTRR